MTSTTPVVKPGFRAGSGSSWPYGLLLLLPVAVFYGVLLRTFTVVPMLDDYWHLLPFALDFHQAHGALHRVGMVLTTQVGPYRLMFAHALLGAQLLLFGKLSFRGMIVLGDLLPLGTWVLLCWNTPRPSGDRGRNLLHLLPVTLLFFNLNDAENLNWALTSLQWNSLLLFVLAAMHTLVRSRDSGRRFAVACGAALMACACSANGMLLWPVGLLYLLLEDRRWSRVLPWCACFAAALEVVVLYHPQPSGIDLRAPVGRQALFFLSFCGGVMENMHHRPVPYVSVAIGLGVMAVVVAAVRTRFDRRQPFFFYTMVWLLLTGVLIANARVGMGLQLSLSSRYKIYADLLLVFCYEFLLDRFAVGPDAERRGRRFVGVAVAVALLICVGGDFAGGVFLATRKHRAETAMRNYLAAPESASPMFLVEDELSPDEVRAEDTARQQLNEAVREGIYVPPEPGHFGLF